MSRHHIDLRAMTDRPRSVAPRRRRSLSRYSLLLVLTLSILLISQMLSNWSLLIQPAAYAADIQMAHSTPGSFSFQQYLKSGPQHSPVKSGPPSPYPQPPKQTPNPGAKPAPPPPSAEPPTMKAINQSLSSAFLAGGTGASALDLKGSDGRLEVQLQPGSLDLAKATISGGKAPSGALTLQVTQTSGHFEAVLNQLGDYQVQVSDPLAQEYLSWLNGAKPTIRLGVQYLSTGTPSLDSELFTLMPQVLNGTLSPEDAARTAQQELDSWYKPPQH